MHIHAGAEELGRVYQPTIALACAMAASARRSRTSIRRRRVRRRGAAGASPSTGLAQAAPRFPAWTDGRSDPAPARALPEDAVFTNGAGNYAVAASLSRIGQAARSSRRPRGDGLRRAGGDRAQLLHPSAR